LDSPHPLLLRAFFWYVLVVSLVTAGLQLFAPSVYIERELRYSATEKSRSRWRALGIVLFLASPAYIWLYFHFSHAGWVVLSVAMTYIGAAESFLRGRLRDASGLKFQSFWFAGLNFVVALGAISYLLRAR
jgi:hypothetical protein